MTGGGGGGDTTTVQKADPWAGVQPYLSSTFADINQLYSQGGPEFYPGQTFVNRDPLETAGVGMNLDYALQQIPGQQWDAQKAQFEMLNAPDVANNPYVHGLMDVATNRLNENLLTNTLPGIRSNAMMTGDVGGTRQALAEAKALQLNQREVGDMQAQILGDAYEQGLTQQARGMAFVPQTMQGGMIPGQQMQEAGAYLRGMDELALQDSMQRWNYEQQAPYSALANELGLYMGTPWGSIGTSSMEGGEGSTLGNALGGAALGYGASQVLSPLLAASGLGMPLAIGGALLGGLFG